MNLTRRSTIAAGTAVMATPLISKLARGQDKAPVRLGVLTDMSGPFRDTNGTGSVVGTQMAVEEFGGKVAGRAVEVISADMQGKVDVTLGVTRQWMSDGVSAIIDVPASNAALAISSVIQERNKVFLATGPASDRLTGDACSPNLVHWTMDTQALAGTVAAPLVAKGEQRWYFITVDYAFGHDLERVASGIVTANGGTVLGSSLHPLNNADFSSYLLAAQAMHPSVIALADGPTDVANVIKQAAEFAMLKSGGPAFAALTLTYQDVLAIGLPTAQGLLLSAPFYWDLSDGTRAFSTRFAERMGGRMPNMVQAGCYSATIHYLKAIRDGADPQDGAAVVKQMKATPTQDIVFGTGSVREDGRKMHPFYLFRVKTPQQSSSPRDVLEVVQEVPASQAFRSLAAGHCAFVQHT